MDQSNFVYIYEILNHINGSKSFDTSLLAFDISLLAYFQSNLTLVLMYSLSLSSGIGDK